MNLATIDLIVRDVPAATAFFRDAVGLEVRVADARFAELGTDTITLMLSPDAMVPVEPARGVILHFLVDDVRQAIDRATAHGADILKGPFTTDWGWESCLFAGPEGVVIDVYRPSEG